MRTDESTKQGGEFNQFGMALSLSIPAHLIWQRWVESELRGLVHLHVRLRTVEVEHYECCLVLDRPSVHLRERVQSLARSVVDVESHVNDMAASNSDNAMFVTIVQLAEESQERAIWAGRSAIRLHPLDSSNDGCVITQITQMPKSLFEVRGVIANGELDNVLFGGRVRPSTFLDCSDFNQGVVKAGSESLDAFTELKSPAEFGHISDYVKDQGDPARGLIVYRRDFVWLTLDVTPHLGVESFRLLVCPDELSPGAVELAGHE